MPAFTMALAKLSQDQHIRAIAAQLEADWRFSDEQVTTAGDAAMLHAQARPVWDFCRLIREADYALYNFITDDFEKSQPGRIATRRQQLQDAMAARDAAWPAAQAAALKAR